MTLQHVILDGALGAAELLALLFVTPALAQPSMPAASSPAAERPVVLHRLSTSPDARLLGALAHTRVAQVPPAAPEDPVSRRPGLARPVEPLDGSRITAARVSAPDEAEEAPPCAGHMRLSEDERRADVLGAPPDIEGVIGAVAQSAVTRAAWGYRVTLPARVVEDAPRALLVDEADGAYLVVLPHRAAARSTLVLRPVSGPAETLDVGAVDARQALLVRVPDRTRLRELACGAIEFELVDGTRRWWATLAAEAAGAAGRVTGPLATRR